MRLTVSQRLWLPPLVIALLTGAAAVLAVRATQRQGVAQAAQVQAEARLQTLGRLRNLEEANAARLSALLLSPGSTLERQIGPETRQAADAAAALQTELAAAFGVAEAQPLAADMAAETAAVAAGAKAYAAAAEEARLLKSQGDVAGAADLLAGKMRPALGGYLAAIERLARAQDGAARALRERLADERRLAQWALLGGLAALALLMVALTVLLARSVLQPLGQVRRMAQRIAQGDLSEDIGTERRDEFGELLHSLAGMQAALRSVVGEVQGAAGSIQMASAEVASGILDLSQRTEQAAGHLQQTAGSMERLTDAVTRAADSAQAAHRLAQSAAQVAAQGAEAVGQVTGVMQRIDTGARQIADILAVIDGIAFQTNILALNAAVEAARAGQHGQGFAVVAEEVRALAGRSADAARQIKALIASSVDNVDAGNQLVQAAAGTMGDLLAAVQRVSGAMSDITAAAGEQREGIGQVNAAVIVLDHMTQQNAALVEQGAAAAQSLNEQACKLSRTVGTFRLQGDGESWVNPHPPEMA